MHVYYIHTHVIYMREREGGRTEREGGRARAEREREREREREKQREREKREGDRAAVRLVYAFYKCAYKYKKSTQGLYIYICIYIYGAQLGGQAGQHYDAHRESGEEDVARAGRHARPNAHTHTDAYTLRARARARVCECVWRRFVNT
jgi:hypothetical protein